MQWLKEGNVLSLFINPILYKIISKSQKTNIDKQLFMSCFSHKYLLLASAADFPIMRSHEISYESVIVHSLAIVCPRQLNSTLIGCNITKCMHPSNSFVLML